MGKPTKRVTFFNGHIFANTAKFYRTLGMRVSDILFTWWPPSGKNLENRKCHVKKK